MSRFALAALGLLALSICPPAQAAPVRPKLIIAISVDQFSANLYDDWRGQYVAGLGRLSQGVIYTGGYQTHASTETCPGTRPC